MCSAIKLPLLLGHQLRVLGFAGAMSEVICFPLVQLKVVASRACAKPCIRLWSQRLRECFTMTLCAAHAAACVGTRYDLRNPTLRFFLAVQNLRAARVQNEFAPEKFSNRYEKRFEKREKGSEKRSETRLKNV